MILIDLVFYKNESGQRAGIRWYIKGHSPSIFLTLYGLTNGLKNRMKMIIL